MDRTRLAERLGTAVNLSLPPIAIALVDEVPAGVPPFEGSAPAGCLFWQTAAERTFATAAADHELCAIGVHTHNLAQPSPNHAEELGKALEVMAELGYVREEDVAQIPTIAAPVRHVVYGPLAEAAVDPDVVLLFADARHGLVLAEAAQQVDPEVPPALGRPACAVVPQAANSGRAAMSLGCCGARAYLDALSDDVALWALPGPALEAYVDRIEALANANSVLTRFHELRRKDVETGGRPTVAESLQRLEASP